MGIFPTNNEYKACSVVWRWEFIAHTLHQKGYQSFISSDGAPAMMCAMKHTNGFGEIYHYLGYSFGLNPQSFSRSSQVTIMPAIQDSLHLANKLKNKIFDASSQIIMGKFIATNSHLQMLLDLPNICKYDHLLTQTDIASDRSHDKMNTAATAKICKQFVIDLLKQHVPGSEGTQLFLTLIQYLLTAFVEYEIEPRNRLFKGIFVSSVCRRWIEQLKSEGKTIDNMITKHCFECIELNICFLLQLVQEGNSHLIPICCSQACEEDFRIFRSLSTLESTQVNFTFSELLSKLKRLQMIQETMCSLKENGFAFNKRHINDEKSANKFLPLHDTECSAIIHNARTAAMKACEDVGIFANECEISFFLMPPSLSTDLSSEMSLFFAELDNDIDDTEDTYAFSESNNNSKIWSFKNLHFLEERSDSSDFIRCDEQGSFIEIFSKSRLLWAIQEDVDHVSTDRTMRFYSKKKNTQYQWKWDDDGSNVFKPNGINKGNIIAMTINDNEMIIGQVLKFQYKQIKGKLLTNIQKRYSYQSLIFEINKNVEILLSPIFQLNNTNTELKEICSFDYIDSNNYVCHIRNSEIDFRNKKFCNCSTHLSVLLKFRDVEIDGS